jgi:ABC-type Na+ efflux pump permease subunit
MMLIRVFYFSSIAAVVLINEYLKDYPSHDPWVEHSLILMSFSVAVDAGIVLARAVQDEIRNQTLSTLLMLPSSAGLIVYSKFAGALMGWLPGPIIELVFTALTSQGRSDLASLAKNEHGGFLLVMLFVLIPHFSPLAATILRWGAVPLAIGLTIGVYFAILAGIVLLGNGNPGVLFFNALTFLMIVICLGCHIGTLLRIQTLAAK